MTAVSHGEDDWEARVAQVWRDAEQHPGDDVLAAVRQLAGQRPDGDPRGLFELACAHDYTGRDAEAEPLYRAALAAGLDEHRRIRAVIQLASTLRNLGRAEEAAGLLVAELAGIESLGLRAAASAFLGLALTDCGRPDEAVGVLLTGLAPLLSEYRRSVSDYGDQLLRRARDSAHQRVASPDS